MDNKKFYVIGLYKRMNVRNVEKGVNTNIEETDL
jgi:hypothetical protein